MKKTGRITAFCLCMALLLTSCGSGNAQSAGGDGSVADRREPEEAEYQGKLEAIEPTAYGNVYGLNLEPGAYLSVIGKKSSGAYWDEIQKGIKQATDDLNAELGYEGSDKVKVTFNAPAEADDTDEQVNILDEELSRYPLAVAISVADQKSCGVQFDLAAENNIPIITFDSSKDYDGLMATVSTDNEAAAREAATKMAEGMGDFGQVIVFTHDSKSQAALSRQAAFVDEMKTNHSHIEVVGIYAMDNLDEMRKEIASKMEQEEIDAVSDEDVIDYILSQYPNVKGCFATNSTSMEAALAGFERMDMDTSRISIVGFDINDNIRAAIEDGTIQGVILQNPFGMGYAAVVASARAALNMGNEAVVDTGYTWVTKDNIKEEEVQKMLY